MSIVKYGVSKHYAGSHVSDPCPLSHLFPHDRSIFEDLASAPKLLQVQDYYDYKIMLDFSDIRKSKLVSGKKIHYERASLGEKGVCSKP